MHSNYILDKDILEEIQFIKDSIYTKKYWTSFDYTNILNEITRIEGRTRAIYLKETSRTLEDVCRQFFDSTFTGDLELFISYFNVILYMAKLRQKVLWHQDYGVFPGEGNL